MKFSENWLRELVDPGVDRARLTQRLTMAGLEVESITELGTSLAGVVVAKIVDCAPHPAADRLRVCRVAAGDETVQIVCGAPNARAGLKAPLATAGAVLPDGNTIREARLRGVESFGMLCSARELGLDAGAQGLLELPPDAPVGMPLADYLNLPDAVIELGLTPNRADCLGMAGLAREVAAEFAVQTRLPAVDAVPARSDAEVFVRLQAGADCPRYCARLIDAIDAAAASPLWLVERLRRAGLRPISALVDVTNYVMLEWGQPLHAFDADAIDGGAIIVRRAERGETLQLLDERVVELDPDFLLIADAQKPLALAGVMGGHGSRVTESTRRVLLESAHFAPSAISGRARRLGFASDAAHRFERGVDPELPRLAIERATQLLLEIAGGVPGPVVEVSLAEHLPRSLPIALRRKRIQRVLGIEIPDDEIVAILRRLDMTIESTDAGWQVTAPARRFDVAIEEDLIEELARIHGYERIPALPPRGEMAPVPAPEQRVSTATLREQFAARDYQEAICYAFIAPELLSTWQLAARAVSLANPLSAELAAMRTSLLPGLTEALRRNRARQQPRVRLFELGRVFQANLEQPGTAPVEIQRLAAVACGPAAAEQWDMPRRGLDFFDLKGDLESLLTCSRPLPGEYRFEPQAPDYLHPGRAATLWRGAVRIGVLGALHPRLLHALDLTEDVYALELDIEPLTQRPLPQAADISRQPSVRRDLAIVVQQELPVATVEAAIRRHAGAALTELVWFDVYRGSGIAPGQKGLAVGLIFREASRTLLESEAESMLNEIRAGLEAEFQAQLRS